MRRKKSGAKKVFTPGEWLDESQIQSFWSRLTAKRRAANTEQINEICPNEEDFQPDHIFQGPEDDFRDAVESVITEDLTGIREEND